MIVKKRPTVAVIAVAGFGTRMLPITKSIEKCMLPVNNRPVIDYIVEDCLKAGITKIIFVTSESNRQLRSYYGQNLLLYEYLKQRGSTALLEGLKGIGAGAEFIYAVQPMERYGTAIPLEIAKEYLGSEDSFLYLMGDDFFVYNNRSCTQKLIDDWAKSRSKHGLVGVQMPESQLPNYGVLELTKNDRLIGLVEKPSPSEAPSDLISVAKYMFDSSILKYLPKILQNINGEYYITDAINMALRDNEEIIISRNTDKYLDCGNPAGWLAANNYIYNIENNELR